VPGALVHRNAETYDRHFHDIDIVRGSHLSMLYPGVRVARVNSIHHQGIKQVAPDFSVEAWSMPDHIPEAIRRRFLRGQAFIAATQWHPEFGSAGEAVLDPGPILHDFLNACERAKVKPLSGHSPFRIRDRAARLLRHALLRRR
jgi:putative glutamine amidotransferase